MSPQGGSPQDATGRQLLSPVSAISPGGQASLGKTGRQPPSSGSKPAGQASAGTPTEEQLPSFSATCQRAHSVALPPVPPAPPAPPASTSDVGASSVQDTTDRVNMRRMRLTSIRHRSRRIAHPAPRGAPGPRYCVWATSAIALVAHLRLDQEPSRHSCATGAQSRGVSPASQLDLALRIPVEAHRRIAARDARHADRDSAQQSAVMTAGACAAPPSVRRTGRNLMSPRSGLNHAPRRKNVCGDHVYFGHALPDAGTRAPASCPEASDCYAGSAQGSIGETAQVQRSSSHDALTFWVPHSVSTS